MEKNYHLISEIVMIGVVAVEKIYSMENLTNPFTKNLFTKVFDGHGDNMDVKCISGMLKASESLLE